MDIITNPVWFFSILTYTIELVEISKFVTLNFSIQRAGWLFKSKWPLKKSPLLATKQLGSYLLFVNHLRRVA